MALEDDILADIMKHEGFREEPYWDHKQWSHGFGTKAKGKNDKITRAQAEKQTLKRIRSDIKRMEKFGGEKGYDWGNNQKRSLASFMYNLGSESLGQLTAGGTRDHATIASKMNEYNKASGQVHQGLANRRKHESELYQQEDTPMAAGITGSSLTGGTNSFSPSFDFSLGAPAARQAGDYNNLFGSVGGGLIGGAGGTGDTGMGGWLSKLGGGLQKGMEFMDNHSDGIGAIGQLAGVGLDMYNNGQTNDMIQQQIDIANQTQSYNKMSNEREFGRRQAWDSYKYGGNGYFDEDAWMKEYNQGQG